MLAYGLVLVTFVILDSIWLTSTINSLYRPALGEMLGENLRIVPAIVFYLLYPLGVEIFAVVPALKSGSILSAITYGALFGLFAYATYDLTNFATLRQWTAQITMIDVAWGAFATGVTAAIACFAAKLAATRFGLTLP
ncbi:MAG: DUF2177 family protein [Rhodopseudomonas sp.]|nr:DUF2177 family protein [Rhodopseudomonas sp.]